MARSRLVAPTVVASMLGLAVLAGCNSGTPASSTSTTVARSAANNGAVPHDLRLAIFDRLPADYTEEPAGSDLDGPLSLAATAAAVDDEETAQQQALLQQYGFRSAYQRTWVVKGTGKTLIIRVQVMGSPTQALGYFNVLTFDGRISGQTTIPTPHLADTSGFTRVFTGSSGSQVSQDINLARGLLFYHLIFTGPQGTITPSDVVRIARSQSKVAASLGYT
jgi:hypothetical protein